jgi:hypothetical protein
MAGSWSAIGSVHPAFDDIHGPFAYVFRIRERFLVGAVRRIEEDSEKHKRTLSCVIASTEGRPGTSTAHLISGARGAIWLSAGPSASTVVSA